MKPGKLRVFSFLCLLLCLCSAACAEVSLNSDNFPDSAFLGAITPYDRDGDGALSDQEIAGVTDLDLRERGITSLKGIEVFENLASLYVNDNSLTELDLRKNTKLSSLQCGRNKLSSLQIAGLDLWQLQCFQNELTSLDVSGMDIAVLHCDLNKLSSLDVSGMKDLQSLSCSGNQLSSLDLGNNPRLERLECAANKLTKLDVSGNPLLKWFSCRNNQLTSLTIGEQKKLEDLLCSGNLLTKLDIGKCSMLKFLDCSQNRFETLDLGNCASLTTLYCWDNLLTGLDISGNKRLQRMSCYRNPFRNLDVSGSPILSGFVEKVARKIVSSPSSSSYDEISELKVDCLVTVTAGDSVSRPVGHSVKLTVEGEGTATAYPDYEKTGKEVTVTATPAEGYELAEISIVSGGVSLRYRYYFNIGDSDVEVKVVFKVPESKLAIDAVNFPDAGLRRLVHVYDLNGDGSLSNLEIAMITVVHPSEDLFRTGEYPQFKAEARTLQGIEHLSALKELYCADLQLTSLDLSHNPRLEVLYCHDNQLTDLKVRGCSALRVLNCDTNPLKSLDLKGNPKLQFLVCGDTHITSLDLTGNPALATVFCEQWCYGWDELKDIDIRGCTKLENLANTSAFGDVITDFFPNQVPYSHIMHGWFTDGNADGNYDNNLDTGLFVNKDTRVFTTTGIVYGNGKKEPYAEPDPVDPVDPDPVTPSSADKVNAFVKRCYSLILNREADEGGLTGWSDALLQKTAAAANIIDGFVKSDEFTNRNLPDSDKVDILYKSMLNREADAGGKAGWVDALSQGYTLQNIINGFCGSAEFKALCQEYGIEPGAVEASAPVDANTPRGKIEAFVKRCYQLILNRAADTGGLKGWSDALEGKTAAAAQIIDGFVRSPEYINRSLSADASVDILYKTMLNREADAGGKAGWVDALGKGYTFQHIINGFCGSAEFTGLCTEYGIEPGSVAVPAKAAAVPEAAAALPDERIGNAVSADEAGQTAVIGYDPAEAEAFVKHAYRAALGREADEAGLAGWSEKILTGAVTPKAFLRSLLFSDELAARQLNNEQYIDMLYHLYLKRGADEAAAGWIEVLVTAGHDEVIRGFESSAEFRAVLAGFGL